MGGLYEQPKPTPIKVKVPKKAKADQLERIANALDISRSCWFDSSPRNQLL